jgi:RNA polymerase sigma-70 factor (ECF subfamily)
VSKQIADTSICSPSENLQKKELQGKVKEAIKSLPEKQKLVVTLAKFQGLSHKEIAEILGSTVMAVKLQLYRARIALKNKLSDYVNQT